MSVYGFPSLMFMKGEMGLGCGTWRKDPQSHGILHSSWSQGARSTSLVESNCPQNRQGTEELCVLNKFFRTRHTEPPSRRDLFSKKKTQDTQKYLVHIMSLKYVISLKPILFAFDSSKFSQKKKKVEVGNAVNPVRD